MSSRWKSRLAALAVVAAATLATLILRPYLAPVNLAMIYLLCVVGLSTRAERDTSVWAALISVAAFDFFCVPPYLTLAVEDTEYLFTFAGMVAVAWVISTRTTRARAQAAEHSAREERAQALYKLSDRLASETQMFDTARVAAEVAGEALEAQAIIFLPENGAISFRRRTSDHLPVPTSEQTIADWAFRNGKKAGWGVDRLLEAKALYVPMKGAQSVVGVLALIPKFPDRFDPRELLIELFAGHTAMAMERALSQNNAEASRIQATSEQFRSTLLSAVSHDLLTPLASISGAASTVRLQGDKLSVETRNELLESIADETERLNRLVRNLLDMTRLQGGSVELRREAVPLEEMIGTSLHRLRTLLKGRAVTTDLPPTLPLVLGDEVLLGQVFVNLLENAAKYTPEATAIEVTARESGEQVMVEVRDHGPGIPAGQEEKVFEKFYRGQKGSSRGSGLGLAIAKAVVEAHGGRIEAHSHPDGGAVFRVFLPTLALPVEEPA